MLVVIVGYTDRADMYMSFLGDRFQPSLNEEAIMFTIRWDTNIPEHEFDDLDGHDWSKSPSEAAMALLSTCNLISKEN